MERVGQHIKEAYQFAARYSTDTSTNVGAKLVAKLADGSEVTVAWGTNRLPTGVVVKPERLARPAKYEWTVHAEKEAIAWAARNGIKTEGLTMFGNWLACGTCAGVIIDAGIIRVVSHQKTMDACPPHWLEPIEIAKQMFKDAGVVYEQWQGDIGEVEILFNGQPFRP